MAEANLTTAATTTKISRHSISFIYLSFIFSLVYFIHSSLLVHRLLLDDGDERVHIKKNSDLHLRFRSDGTFKILQVSRFAFNRFLGFFCNG